MQGRRKHHLTSRIKPATKHALMAQLALAADEIELLRRRHDDDLQEMDRLGGEVERRRRLNKLDNALATRLIHDAWGEIAALRIVQSRPWWRRLMWWRS